MKWLTSFISLLFLAGILVAVPCGCGESNQATDIDASDFDDGTSLDDEEMTEEDEADDEEE